MVSPLHIFPKRAVTSPNKLKFPQSFVYVMDRGDTGLDFQRILVTEDESFDSHNNIITQLNLEDRLPEGRQTCERLLKNLGLQPEREHQGDRTCNQFIHVFQGQCLVLGDSGVGKTSLVKSLTGKPFDLEQPKTQGVEYSVVDQKWQNLDLKDLVFGNFSRFFDEVLVQLTVFGKAGNVIVQESTNVVIDYRSPMRALFSRPSTAISVFLVFLFYQCGLARDPEQLFLFSMFFIGDILSLLFYWERFRSIVITCVFITNHRGLLMGTFLSVMLKGYFSGRISIIYAFLFIATVVLLMFEVFYLLTKSLRSFGIERKCRYPGQLKLKNQQPVEVIFIGRFVVTVIIGFTFFTVLMKYNVSKTKELTRVMAVLDFYCHGFLIVQSVPRIVKSLQTWHHKALFIVAIFEFHCFGLSLLSPDVYFVITFLIFFCDTVYKEYFCLISALATPGNDHEVSTMFTAVCIEKVVINQIKLAIALYQMFRSLKLKILDFAGDKEYHAYHHIFLRSQAIYLIVFNMAEFAENSFRDINARIKKLHLWFESVCSHVPPKMPVFLVGTHRGDMNKILMGRLNCHLKENLWNLYCNEIVENNVEELIFFPVENSLGQNDAGIQILQKKIMIVAKEYKETIGRNIPLSWIQIQDEIISLKENKEAKFCVTLEEFPTVFGNFICTNWSKETLKYLHEKGLVIYLDKDQELSKWVLLKPEILVDIIIQLVTPPQQMMQERRLRRDWELLKDKGMLTKSLLKRILSKAVHENEEAMTAFLEEYDLICPLAYKNAQMNSSEQLSLTHFVPSLLPMSANECTLWDDETTDKKFYVFFKKFLPEPLFYCLLSRAHKNSKVEFPRSQPVVFRDVGKFWMSPWQPYRLKLMKDMKMIEVTLNCRYQKLNSSTLVK